MKSRILAPTAENLARLSQALRNDELVGMPTETVYGLAGSAFSEKALSRIFATKERPHFDPLIVHIAEPTDATWKSDPLGLLTKAELIDSAQLSKQARELVHTLLRALWPGPLTLVLPKNPRVPDLATSGLESVGVRMPAHPVAQALLRECKLPLAAPSANRFGRISPTRADHVQQELGDRIEWILDGGPCSVGVESTVLKIEPSGEPRLLRPGGVPLEQLEKLTGAPIIAIHAPSIPSEAALAAPGMLASHYAPAKPLRLLSESLSSLSDAAVARLFDCEAKSLGLLLLSGDAARQEQRLRALLGKPVFVRSLSAHGELEEMAQRLFGELRALDESAAEALWSESFARPIPQLRGLEHAIADRLGRAAAKRT